MALSTAGKPRSWPGSSGCWPGTSRAPLASASRDGTTRIWDAVTGRERALLADRGGPTTAVAPDGSWLATASQDGTARIWDATTGQLRITHTGHHGGVLAVAVAPDGNLVATCSDDRTLRIWNTAAWHVQALMRVDNAVGICDWINNEGIAVASCYRPRYLNIQRLNYLWTIRHSSARIAGNLIT